jgi:Predicted signal transduction protein with a C-terminal ATPase domain
MKIHFKKAIRTISFKLFTIILGIVTLLIALYSYNNFQARDILLQQVQVTHSNMLQTYLNQIENQMKAAMTYTITQTLSSPSIRQLADTSAETQVQYAKIQAVNEFRKQIATNNLIDGFFIISKSINDDTDVLSITQSNVSTAERVILQNYTKNIIHTIDDNLNSGDSKWKVDSIDGNNYLIQIATFKQEVFIASYINMERLLQHFSPSDTIGSQLFCLPISEAAQITEKADNSLLFVIQNSSLAPICLVEALPTNTILNELPFMQKYIMIISILLLLVIPILIFSLHKIIVLPLQKLASAMKQIQSGNLDTRIAPYQTSLEFDLVNKTFNQMITQVQDLKINVYEEKIKAQHSQLRNLQLQIRPHFLINSLNMIYNFIENNEQDAAKQLIRYSADYFRHMVKVDENFVSINEELSHVKTYLEIQSLRYPNMFTYSIDIDKMIADMLIPPVLIQNFVENSMKYAILTTGTIHITITINSFEIDYYTYAKIIISDSGIGYPPEQLQSLNNGEKIINQYGEHLGICNTIQRLCALYDGKASWHFYNDNGAISEIILPVKYSDVKI